MKKYFENIKYCFKNSRVRWRQHALSRMLERGISRKDVQTAVTEGEQIEYYHASKPFPGCLILGFSRKVPFHVVVSIDIEESIGYVVTSYVPDTNYFDEDLKTRKNGGKMKYKKDCPFCGGTFEKGRTTFTVDYQSGVVVVRNVAAYICDQCGEAWIEDQVAAELERIVSKARQEKNEFQVIQMAA